MARAGTGRQGASTVRHGPIHFSHGRFMLPADPRSTCGCSFSSSTGNNRGALDRRHRDLRFGQIVTRKGDQYSHNGAGKDHVFVARRCVCPPVARQCCAAARRWSRPPILTGIFDGEFRAAHKNRANSYCKTLPLLAVRVARDLPVTAQKARRPARSSCAPGGRARPRCVAGRPAAARHSARTVRRNAGPSCAPRRRRWRDGAAARRRDRRKS